jgi:hypothetical protein
LPEFGKLAGAFGFDVASLQAVAQLRRQVGDLCRRQGLAALGSLFGGGSRIVADEQG